LAESLVETADEETRQRLSAQEPDDGYVIHHCPNVPRVRSRPSEHIVFIEREAVNLTDLEMGKLLECEGLDYEDEIRPDEIWSESKHRTVFIDLRFCNGIDGYIPLVKEVRGILPPLADGETIEFSWQDDPESWFPCKVSKTKRAIYNLEGKLRQLFELLPSGVRLYITRVGPRRYRLNLNRQPHTVRNCKFFVGDGQCGWKVEFRDENVEWETGDEVFRHQLTFQQIQPGIAVSRFSELTRYYPVRARLGRDWTFQVYRNRLDDYQDDNNACLVVFCDFASARERRFLIPISYLEKEILQRAFLDERKRYTFSVSQNDYMFTWQHGIHMDGNPFLDKSDSPFGNSADYFNDFV